MTRKKSSPEPYDNPPTPEVDRSEPAPSAAPVPSHTSPSSPNTNTASMNCSICGSDFSDSLRQDFDDHVATCGRARHRASSPAASDSSLSSLATPEPEHINAVDPVTDVIPTILPGSIRTSPRNSVDVDDNHPSQGSTDHLSMSPGIASSKNSVSAPNSVIDSASHGNVDEAHDENSVNAYITPTEWDYYDDAVEDVPTLVAEASNVDMEEASLAADKISPNLEVVVDKPDAETPSLEKPDPLATAPILTRTNTGSSTSTNLLPELSVTRSAVDSSQEPWETNSGPAEAAKLHPGTGIRKPLKITSSDSPPLDSPPSLSTQATVVDNSDIPFAPLYPPPASQSSQSSAVNNSKPKPDRIRFKKITAVENFEKYLENPEELSYEELYRRTAVVSDALYEWQTEFDGLNSNLKAFELQNRLQKKIADDAAKEENDKRQLEDDALLIDLHERYNVQLKYTSIEWRNFTDEFKELHTSREGVKEFELLKTLRNNQTMINVHKRQVLARKREVEPELENLLLPKLTSQDTESYLFKRKLTIDPQVFEDKKQADVLAFPWSKDPKDIGFQKPKIRRGVDAKVKDKAAEKKPENGKDAADPVENGRPQRNRGRRALYDTDQSEAAESENEELPTKRRRTQRFPEGRNGPSANATAQGTRESSPVVKTFPSGKRIGRPPGAKTKVKIPKSKLQSVQVPPESQSPDAEQVDGEPTEETNLASEKNDQALAPNEEEQLQVAAESLINKTRADQAAPVVKSKQSGGRAKKNANAESSGSIQSIPGPGDVPVGPKPKARGGRAKKNTLPKAEAPPTLAPAKPKAKATRVKKEPNNKKYDVGLEDDEDILPSTEQDDGSQFASDSTSRPTSSSSMETTSSLGNRRPARAGPHSKTREMSAPAKTTPKKQRGGKRKRTEDNIGAEEVTTFPGEPAVNLTSPPSKKRKTRVEKSQSSTRTAATESTEPTSRPKRKRAQSYAEPADFEDLEEDDFATSPPPKKARSRSTNKSASKAKAVKHDETSEEPEMMDIDESSAPAPPATQRPARKSAPTKFIAELEELESPIDAPELQQASAPPTVTKRPVSRGGGKKAPAKGKGKSTSLPAQELIDPSEPKPEPTEQELEAARKKKQKSEKLSASAKRRWANGDMEAAMVKRKETNAAKKAAREAAKLSANGIAPAAGSIAAAPAQPDSPSSALGFAPPAASAGPSAPRISGRAKKPSRLVMANVGMEMDGAGASSESDREPRVSEYDTFRALSSPKDPLTLGKRQRKMTYNIADLMNDDDEEEDDY